MDVKRRPSSATWSNAHASCRSSSTSGRPGAAPAARFGITSIPTVAVFRDGQRVTGFVGAYPPATIGKFLDDLLAKAAEAAAA